MAGYPEWMILKMDDLESLRQALNDLEAMPLLDQARALPGLMDQAREALARRRGAVFDALAGPGKPMSIAGLARELGIHRSKVDDAIALHRKALALTDSESLPPGSLPYTGHPGMSDPGERAASHVAEHVKDGYTLRSFPVSETISRGIKE